MNIKDKGDKTDAVKYYIEGFGYKNHVKEERYVTVYKDLLIIENDNEELLKMDLSNYANKRIVKFKSLPNTGWGLSDAPVGSLCIGKNEVFVYSKYKSNSEGAVYYINEIMKNNEIKIGIAISNLKSNLKELIGEYNKQNCILWEKLFIDKPILETNQKIIDIKRCTSNHRIGKGWLSYDTSNLYISRNIPGKEIIPPQNINNINIENYECAEIEYNRIRDDLKNNILSDIELIIEKIPYKSIVFYREQGEITTKQHVTGEGGGSNLAGAAIGGILFGGAGAIIGSRNKTIIKTTDVKEDNRYVELRYHDIDKKIVSVDLSYNTFELFNKIIPDKEYSYVQLEKDSKNSEIRVSEEDPIEKIGKLKKLLDVGAITQEEYDKSKEKLLAEL